MKLLDLLNVLVPVQYIYVISEEGHELFYGVVNDIPMKYTRLKVKKVMSEMNTQRKRTELIIWTIN